MKRILIIDDDKELCGEMGEILDSEGYCVSIVHNGDEGVRMIDESGCDLVIIDLKIPGLKGLEVLKYARKKNPELGIIIVTGSQVFKTSLNEEVHFDEARQDAILKYADGMFSKPFDVGLLLSRISTLIAAAEQKDR